MSRIASSTYNMYITMSYENESCYLSIISGLAVSDLASLITMCWTCISYTFIVVAANLPFEILDVAYLISGMPHFAFVRVSSCITAMITLERCLCIVAPLKVSLK